MKKIIVFTMMYFIGLVVFFLTGICEMNWLFYIAIGLGVIGSILIVLKQSNIRNNE